MGPPGSREWKRFPPAMSWNLIASILSIVVINIVLSGDNALVIGMASHRLLPRQRRWAIVLGGAGAIVLRIGFTAVAVLLLGVPFLEGVGGLVLTWIAYRLLRDEDEGARQIDATESLLTAVRTIIVADLVMSLDNILAIGGAAHGSIELLILGLVLSMPLILVGSSLLARLMNRFPWLTILGSVVLTITAARMVVDDPIVVAAVTGAAHLALLVALATVMTLAVLVPTLRRRRDARRDAGSRYQALGVPSGGHEGAGRG